MSQGEERLLTATVSPENASNKKVTWTVDNPNVARVANNVVYAVADGEAIITCTAADGSDVKATCKVVVGVTHEYVDLGLPSGVLWATCNVGTEDPFSYGDFFAWGETVPQLDKQYGWDSYKWCEGSASSITKYMTKSSKYQVDNKTELEREDDAAHVNWGGQWRMPTRAELCELLDKCYWVWTSSYNNSGISGYIVYKAKNETDRGVKVFQGGIPSNNYNLLDILVYYLL